MKVTLDENKQMLQDYIQSQLKDATSFNDLNGTLANFNAEKDLNDLQRLTDSLQKSQRINLPPLERITEEMLSPRRTLSVFPSNPGAGESTKEVREQVKKLDL